tara:strand:- start:723 stop:926 length:204 start_codon:yes stop_codon:yes gene_type:complete
MTIRIKKTEEMKKADKARRNKEYYEKLKSGNVLRFGANKGQGRDNYKPPKTPLHLIVKQGPITLKFD